MTTKKYKWVAECSDGAFYDESDKCFETKKECYDDMRNHALEKMKWNTEYNNDFEDIGDDDYIGYNVRFSQNMITHESYSGLYTYEIKELVKMKTLELTQEACALIADAVKDKIAMWEDHNRIIAMHGIDDTVQHYISKNNKKIGELITLLDYINS